MFQPVRSSTAAAGLLMALLIVGGCGSTPPSSGVGDADGTTTTYQAEPVEALRTTSRIDQFDTFGDERLACRELFDLTLYGKAIDCCQQLWDESAAGMSARGRIELLLLMSEIYLSTGNDADAKACYSKILDIDDHWLPEDFDDLPKNWREIIIGAYHDSGWDPRRPKGFQNLALFDFEIGDMTPGENNLSRIEKSLADYITTYLQSSLNDMNQAGGPSLRVVSYRDRGTLMNEIAGQWGLDAGQAVHADMVDQSTLVSTGRMLAVQAFLRGSIIRFPNDKIVVNFRITRIETGEETCGKSQEGDLDDLSKLLQEALNECIGCAVEGVHLPQDAGPEQLGPMQRAVAALSDFHEAIALYEQGEYPEALTLARSASDLRPGVPEFAKLARDISATQERVALMDEADLPSPSFESF